ncbi:hypothetical protein [Streptomyces sp. SID13031]|uniref:hypothetical protein n=1 Tax=Streptomyces sp. SID13031 TaxID=2706046 RepID=UPI0013C7026F|nr:hypothetical protein [Streptomyces sp. SID13031]NEA35543.1 hypothetical protein [Streptomyces sp. SID13031]
MIAERMVYSPAVLAATTVLIIILLGLTARLSTTIEHWPQQASFCRDHHPMAASGHKPGWCI